MRTYLTVFYSGCLFIALFFADPIRASAQCTSDFSFSVNDSGNTVHFINLSVPLSNNAYYWQFGDSSTSGEKDPLHVYTDKGTYTVCLIRKDGLCPDTVCKTVEVRPDSCALNFTYVIGPTLGKVSFFNHSAGTPDAFQWDFGDVTSTSGHRDVIHHYTFENTFRVCLTRKPVGSNCEGTICKLVMIDPDNCHVDFSSSIDQQTRTVTFYNSSYSPLNTGFTWYFDDGDSSLERSPLHTYAALGTYKVCLVKTDEVCTDTVCKMIELDGKYPCSVAFSMHPDSVNDRLIRFSNLSEGRDLSYRWSVNPGSATSDTKDFSYLFAHDGYYDVCLNIQEADSFCNSARCTRVLIYSGAAGCEAHFTYQTLVDSITRSARITFLNQSPGNHKTSSWDFGDGHSSKERSPVHDYSTSGTFTVCLVIYDTIIGCSDTLCKIIQIMPDTNTGLHNRSIDLQQVGLYPVPLEDKLTITFNNGREQFVTIRIFNILGSSEVEKTVKAQSGSNTMEMNTTHMPEGIYFVEISTDRGSIRKRLVK